MSSRKAALAASNPLAKRPSLSELTESALPPMGVAAPEPQPSVELADTDIVAGPFRFTKVGMDFEGPITREQWQAAGLFLKQSSTSMIWWIGDWVNVANPEWGEMYKDATQITGLTYDYLRNVASTAGQVHLSLRSDKLSFAHHRLIGPLPPEEQRKWIAVAESEHLSVRKLKERLLSADDDTDDDDGDNAMLSSLLNKGNRRVFNRVWRNLSEKQPPSPEDIAYLVEWVQTIQQWAEAVTSSE